jgi:hypothetical protein
VSKAYQTSTTYRVFDAEQVVPTQPHMFLLARWAGAAEKRRDGLGPATRQGLQGRRGVAHVNAVAPGQCQ